MSEEEEQGRQEKISKDLHCYLAWKMDSKFREILSKKTPNYLQHLKTLPSNDTRDCIYQRAKWSHYSMHPPQINNFFKKLKGVAENPDSKSDGISDTDSIRTEDFESRFTELLVPAPSIGSESQETIKADIRDKVEIDGRNNIATEEELLEPVTIENAPAASIECSDMHKWKIPDVAKQRYESKSMVPKSFIKEEKVKNSALKEEDVPNNEKQKKSINNAYSCNKEIFTESDDKVDKFRQLPNCSQSALWCLVNEIQTHPGVNNEQTYQENALKQKVEQLIAENIKLSAEKALLIDEVKEIKNTKEFGAIFKLQKSQDDCSKLIADNQMLRAKCTKLESKLISQSETISELTQQNDQYSNRMVQLENNEKLLTDNTSKLNTQLEHNALKIIGLEDQVKDLKEQLCHEKELSQKKSQEHLESMTILEKQSKESLSNLEKDHQQKFEKLKNACNVEQKELIEKYELRLARQVTAQTSQDAMKESQISSLKSKLIKLEFEQEYEKQKWKQILVENDDGSKKKNQGSQQSCTDSKYQPQSNYLMSQLHQKLENANKQILSLNAANQQLCQRIGHLREELSKLREMDKSREERSWNISENREILTQHNQLMIQDLKDKITKEMHVEVLSLMQRLHQQEDELVYMKSMWNKMLKSLHLLECEGNNSTVFGMDKLEILIAGLLNEESHLNMNILGVKYLSRLTKSVCGKAETGKYPSLLADKPTLDRYFQEPIRTAFNRLHSTSQQLRDLVKSLSKNDSHDPLLEIYPATQATSIHGEFPVGGASRENNMFRPFIGISSTSSAGCTANGFDEESKRMIMLECDLNHQAKVLLELMRSYNGLQEALVTSHSSLHVQKELNRNSGAE